MSTTVTDVVDITIRLCVPYMVMFIFFVLGMVSFSMPLSTTIEIPFTLIIVYYWSIYRPTLISPFLVFICGVCLDLMSGLPLGLSAFVLLIVRHLISEQRLFLMGQPFVVLWFGYGVVSTLALFVQWAMFGLLHLYWTPIVPIVLMNVAGILFFPLMSVFLNLSHKVLPMLPDQYSAVK